ncbi:hypothetical protein CJ030_MR7G009307 [Morella rubra]|uniref:Uncharacterized protein n=1 Tax=Morella rubra TaxID=262757 RepID=A0A6A1V221_9ROSI|nr:hypothetical protein CJ030_MR7G009307 [Morella rubra]
MNDCYEYDMSYCINISWVWETIIHPERNPYPEVVLGSGDGTAHSGIVQATTERIVVGIPRQWNKCMPNRVLTWQMMIFMSEQTLDFDTYILVVKIWTYITDAFEVYLGYKPQWFFKGPPLPPLPCVKDFELVDVDPALLHIVPPPPALPVEGSGETVFINLTSDTEPED